MSIEMWKLSADAWNIHDSGALSAPFYVLHRGDVATSVLMLSRERPSAFSSERSNCVVEVVSTLAIDHPGSLRGPHLAF